MLLNYLLDEDTKTESYTITNKKNAYKMPFMADSFGRFDCAPSYFTERDGFPICLLLYTEQGAGYLEYRDQKLIIPENCAAVIDCREYQLYRSASDDRWRFCWIHFSGKCACDFEGLINEAGPAVINFTGRLHFDRFYQELVRLTSAPDRYTELKLSNLLGELLSQMLLSRQRLELHARYREHRADIERSIEYIRVHYQEPLTVDMLAEISCISKYYYIRIFRELIGDTPYNYLSLYRINQSKRLLADTDFSVSQIASLSGFSNVKNYITCFNRATGTTPLKYRQTSLI